MRVPGPRAVTLISIAVARNLAILRFLPDNGHDTITAISSRAPRTTQEDDLALQASDEGQRLRRFKAEFFQALGHPLRIQILELLRDGPMSVGDIQQATGAAGSSVSQQLGVLLARSAVTTERRGTTILYSVPDPALFELLDVARRIFNTNLSGAVELLRLVDREAVAAGER